MKYRILYHKDKTVSVIHPVLKSKHKNETENEWLKRVLDKATPKNAIYEDVSELPSKSERMAWRGEKGKGIKTDKKILKQINKDKRRQELIDKEKQIILEEEAIKRLKERGEL